MRHSITCVLGPLPGAFRSDCWGLYDSRRPNGRRPDCWGDPGPGHPEAAKDLNAEVLQHIREGRYREGIPKAREALALREQALGPCGESCLKNRVR